MTTFFDLIVMLFWPVVSAAAAWAIAIYALAQKDEISEVVEALTGSNGVHEKRKAGSGFFTPQQLSAILSGDQVGFRFISDACGHSPTYQGERRSDEKNVFARR